MNPINHIDFFYLIKQIFSECIPEYKFHPTRKWRADFGVPALKILIEIEGGVYSRGRHTRGSGFLKDMEKYNAATILGYRVLRYAPHEIDRAADELKRLKKCLTGTAGHEIIDTGGNDGTK